MIDNSRLTDALRRLTAHENELRRSQRQKLQDYAICRSKSEKRRLKGELAAIEENLHFIYTETKNITKELENMNDREYLSPDEAPQPYNECVGCCYGIAVFVDDSMNILYTEDPTEIYSVGETIIDDGCLEPFDELPEARQKLLLEWLDASPDTPESFKHRND